jgi:branched-chain amino acid transport system substrate-binding protein
LLVDLTGPASSSLKTSVQGVQAGIDLARQQGYHINLVVADTTSTPAGTLSAAQRLVEHDHVLAVIAESALTFAAAGFLTQQGVPVIGPSLDGEEWLTARNMFAEHSPDEPSRVPATVGNFLKLEGVTSLGSLGYAGAPNSAAAAQAYAVSAKHAGLKVGYLNTSVPLGSTNVAPLALGM